MATMDSATIAVLIIAAAFFGFGMWLQWQSHRNTNSQQSPDLTAGSAETKPTKLR